MILTGGIAALVYAYLVRFLAVALQSVEAGLAKVTPSMDDAARSLGTAPLGILTRVHAPLLAPSLLTAALMVFVDVMKELPATFMMRPFNFDTLAVHAYNLASDERLSELAAPALTIVAVGLVPLVVLSRSSCAPAWPRSARANVPRAVERRAAETPSLGPLLETRDRSRDLLRGRLVLARIHRQVQRIGLELAERAPAAALSGLTEATTGHSLLPLAK